MVILPEYVKFVMQREKMKKEQKTTTNKQETCPVLNVSCLPLKCVEKTIVTVVIYVMKITLHETHTHVEVCCECHPTGQIHSTQY